MIGDPKCPSCGRWNCSFFWNSKSCITNTQKQDLWVGDPYINCPYCHTFIADSKDYISHLRVCTGVKREQAKMSNDKELFKIDMFNYLRNMIRDIKKRIQKDSSDKISTKLIITFTNTDGNKQEIEIHG